MLTNLWTKVDGYKSYALGLLAVFVGLVGHFWGPISVGPIQIPAMTWADTWHLAWEGGLVVSGRSAIDKLISIFKK